MIVLFLMLTFAGMVAASLFATLSLLCMSARDRRDVAAERAKARADLIDRLRVECGTPQEAREASMRMWDRSLT